MTLSHVWIRSTPVLISVYILGGLIILRTWAFAIWLRVVTQFSLHGFLPLVRIIALSYFLITTRSGKPITLWASPTLEAQLMRSVLLGALESAWLLARILLKKLLITTSSLWRSHLQVWVFCIGKSVRDLLRINRSLCAAKPFIAHYVGL